LHHDAGSFGHLELRFRCLAQLGAAIVLFDAHDAARIADEKALGGKGFDLRLHEQFVDVPHGPVRIGTGAAVCKDKNASQESAAARFIEYVGLRGASTIVGSKKPGRRVCGSGVLAGQARVNTANKQTLAPNEQAARSRDEGLLDQIGNTPLLRIGRVAADFPNVEFYGKAEWFNPGGSVKDRAAYAMIRDGERRGALRAGKTILDATSGNTGIAYAMVGAALGYPVKLFLPTSASPERKQILQAYGAEIVYTPGDEGTDGAIRRVRELYQAAPERYFYPDQYSNPANPNAHYETTGPEIWEQTQGRVTHFVAGLGTSGTFVGTTRRLKELNPAIRCISFQPDSGFHGLEGLKHMATAIVPSIYDPTLADEDIAVQTEDAQQLAKRLAREEGLLVGVSAAGALWASMHVARQLPPGQNAVIVTVFPDAADKYLSEKFWSEE
jgi:S-sulfo-L-cysteine synthase (O-acetyl-L-serine-dependent)